MINVATASFVATVDEEYDEETGNSWFVGRVRLSGEIIWEVQVTIEDDANDVIQNFAHKLAELFHEQ